MAGKFKKWFRHRSSTSKVLTKLRAVYQSGSRLISTSDLACDVLVLEQKSKTKAGKGYGSQRLDVFGVRPKYVTEDTNYTVAEKRVEKNKAENPKLDLSNIKIVTPAQPSRESEIIHQFSILSRYLQFGLKKESFKAAYEKEIIERYEQLNKQEQRNAFDKLKKEFNGL